MRNWPWRTWLIWAAILLLLAGVFAWLATIFEITDVQSRTPPTGEAATNPLYAAQALARGLGADVALHTSLDPLPPPGATLVLTTNHWNLLPGRDDALRDWVRQGGHLVIPGRLLRDNDEDGPLIRWLPVRWPKAKASTTCAAEPKASADARARPETPSQSDPDDDDDDSAAVDQNNSGNPPRQTDKQGKSTCGQQGDTGQDGEPALDLRRNDACRFLGETGDAAGPGFRICETFVWGVEPKPDETVQWSASEAGRHPALLRVAAGKGSVTAIGIWDAMTWQHILRADHGQAWAATLRLRPGMQLWFVSEESRESLLAWLWRQGWAALLLGLLALAAALWRAAPRFGPRLALPRVERRSMAEQIIGTAHFLARSDAQALHRAQLRALDEAAALRLPSWARLDLPTRARAIAALTNLRDSALASAMTSGARSAANLEADLCYLETAVRRLRAGAAAPSKTSFH